MNKIVYLKVVALMHRVRRIKPDNTSRNQLSLNMKLDNMLQLFMRARARAIDCCSVSSASFIQTLFNLGSSLYAFYIQKIPRNALFIPRNLTDSLD